jgi:hypothetical protein
MGLNPVSATTEFDQYSAKPDALHGVDHLHKSDAALQVRLEGRMRITVLALRSVADAIGKDRLEAVIVRANDV